MSQQNEMLSKPSHMEVAAKTWALDKAREIRGQVVDGILNQTQATVGYLGAIRLTEDYMEGFLAAWLARNLMDFTRVYYSDMEERLTHAERLAQEAIARNPLSVTIQKADSTL